MRSLFGARFSMLAYALVASTVLLGSLAPIAPAESQNGTFSNREVLSREIPVEIVESNVGTATQSKEPPLGPEGAGHTIWFEWDAPAYGEYVISTCASAFPTRIDLYERDWGYADSLVPIHQPRTAGTPAEECRWTVTAPEGEGFEIRIDGLARDEGTGEPIAGEGTVKLQITTPPPPNDDFAHAERKTFTSPGFEQEYEYEFRVGDTNNYAATSEPGEPFHGGQPASASLWYVFTTPEAWEPGEQGFNTRVSPGWNPGSGHLFSVYRGNSLTGLEPVEEGEYDPRQIQLAPNTTYYLAIDEYYDPREDRHQRGNVNLTLDLKVPLSKNEFHLAMMRHMENEVREREEAKATMGPPAPAIPPQTSLSGSAISAGAALAKFTFTSEPKATFRCRLDSGSWGACKSPRTYRNLVRGRHIFRVAAVGPTGAVDSTPAAVGFKIAKRRHRHHG